MNSKILIPLDETPFSRQVFPFVRQPQGTHINLLRIAKTPPLPSAIPQPLLMRGDLSFAPYTSPVGVPVQTQPQPIYSGEEAEHFRKELASELEPDLSHLQKEGYTVTVTVHFGNPADEIADFAKNEQVDVVAMATHGRTGLSKLLQGSVAEAVLHKLAIPLLLVHAKEEDGTESPADSDEKTDAEHGESQQSAREARL